MLGVVVAVVFAALLMALSSGDGVTIDAVDIALEALANGSVGWPSRVERTL